MMKVMWKQIWREFKNNALYFVGTLILWTLIAFFVILFVGNLFYVDTMQGMSGEEGINFMSAEMMDPNSFITKTFMITCSVVTFIMVAQELKRFPICLMRALYICPTDIKIRYSCLKKYLWFKTGLSMAFCFCVMILIFGVPILSAMELPTVVLYVLLLFFFSLDMNLKFDPGNRPKKSPEKMSDEWEGSTVSRVYWHLILILEQIFFYWFYASNAQWTPLFVIIWSGVLIINVILARYCISSVLTGMLSYEKIYVPIEEVEEP